MGTTCQNCPTSPGAFELPVPDIGLPEHTQSLIAQIRDKYKHEATKMQEHRLPEGRRYRGQLLAGKKNGYGELTNGENVYYGGFMDDLPEGEGLIIKGHGDYVKGTFRAGVLNGAVKEKLADSEFTGHYSQGHKLKGILTTKQYIYEGGFQDNKFYGYGTLAFQNGDTYQGDFLNGLYQGDGVYDSKQLGIYRGQFKNGQYHGRGVFKWREDEYYEGEYSEGTRNGYGKFVRGNLRHEGVWVGGQLEQTGKSITVQ